MASTRKPLTEGQKARKLAYDSQYVMAHQSQRKIVFNDMVDEDNEMKAWLDSKPNINKYLKELIREDMKRSGK